MKSQLVTFVFIVIINAVGASFYLKEYDGVEQLVALQDTSHLCKQELADLIRDNFECRKFISTIPVFTQFKKPHDLLVRELDEFFVAEEGIKDLKREIIKEQLGVFNQSIQSNKDSLIERTTYLEYLIILFDTVIVLFYLYFTWKVFRNRGEKKRELPRLKSLFTFLLEQHFKEMVPYYKSIAVPEKGDIPISDDFLGTIFFSLLKINKLVKDKYASLSSIEVRVEQSSKFLRITQRMNFMNDDSFASNVVKEEMDYQILLGLVESQRGYMKFDKDESSAREFLEIYVRVEDDAHRS